MLVSYVTVHVTLQKFVTGFANEAAVSVQYIAIDEGLNTDI